MSILVTRASPQLGESKHPGHLGIRRFVMPVDLTVKGANSISLLDSHYHCAKGSLDFHLPSECIYPFLYQWSCWHSVGLFLSIQARARPSANEHHRKCAVVFGRETGFQQSIGFSCEMRNSCRDYCVLLPSVYRQGNRPFFVYIEWWLSSWGWIWSEQSIEYSRLHK